MVVFPNAKINLGLFVTGRREDGYHNLETIFYPVKVEDVLEIVPAGDISIHISGLEVAGDMAHNLVRKAFDLLQKDFPEKIRPVAIYLHKAIPMGAGMGGGSSDGAFMLRLLNRYFDLGIDQDRMNTYALALGSDCPFFMINTPSFATGRGELLEPIDLSLANYNIQLVCPEVHISTATAFHSIQPKEATVQLKEIIKLPVEEWQHHVFNDFEATVFPHYPLLSQIKEQLYTQGALYASMSGTGSTVYGIFPEGGRATISIDHPFRNFVTGILP